MSYPCEFSSLTVPSDHAYRSVVAGYVVEVAKKIGFPDSDVRNIDAGVNLAVGHVIDYSFTPDETGSIDVSCERIPVGLKISIRDRGLPFDQHHLAFTRLEDRLKQEIASTCRWVQVKDYVDEVAFNNLGKQGKETVLIKHLQNRSITDYYEACELEPFDPAEPQRPETPPGQEYVVRKMADDEAVQVSRCVYRAYGYTYGYEHLYYPERLVEMNRSGQALSAVAVAPGNIIIGHCALSIHGEGARIAEIGRAVVVPEYRGLGCFNKLSSFLLDAGKDLGLVGIYGQAVSNHTYSQQVGRRLGMKDCGITLGLLPQNVTFKGITEHLSSRLSVINHFVYLHEPTAVEVYAPAHHAEIIGTTYRYLGASPTMSEPAGVSPYGLTGDSVVKTEFIRSLNEAIIEVHRYGSDAVQMVHRLLKELRLKKTDIIELELNLCDPFTAILAEKFEAMGFFYSGILPGAMSDGDALILQYLNNVYIDYERIRTESEMARELLAYVKAGDPNFAE